MKKKIFIGLFSLLVIGAIIIVFCLKDTEEIVAIKDVDFTLNDIKMNFQKTEFAKKNKCKCEVLEDTFKVDCQNREYEFLFDGIELSILTNNLDKDLIMSLVNTVEELNGYKKGEYLNTIEAVINGKTYIAGIELIDEGNNTYFRFVVNEKLDLYEKKNTVGNDVLKEVNDVNYDYETNKGYITNLFLAKEFDYYIFGGTYSGDLNNNLTIKFYDVSKNLLKEETVALKDYDTYGNRVLNFIVNVEFEASIIENVKYYSITIL